MTKLTDIESIGEKYSQKLKDAGVGSVEALLSQGGKKTGRSAIAQSTGLSEKQILNWVNRADLSRVKGIGTQYADLLEHSGIDTVPELATRNAQNLHTKMAEINTQKNLVRSLPSLKQVEEWTAQAKNLPRAIEY